MNLLFLLSQNESKLWNCLNIVTTNISRLVMMKKHSIFEPYIGLLTNKSIKIYVFCIYLLYKYELLLNFRKEK